MYCKICGNLLSNEDTICKACGSEVIMDAKPEINFKEQVAPEVIFNPPFDSLPKRGNNEVEEKKEGRIGRPDTGEFSWNVYDFPKPQKVEPIKTETANFNWSSEEIEAEKEAQAEFQSRILNEDLKVELAEDKFQTKNLSELGIFDEKSEEKSNTNTIEIEKSLFVKDFENVLFKKEEPKVEVKEEPKVEVKEELNLLDQLLKGDEPLSNMPKVEMPVMPVINVAPQVEAQPVVEDEEIITKSDMEKATYEQFSEKGIEPSADKDKFFTFSKKNEEFQRLLDKEYARINGVEEVPKATTLEPVETIPTLEPIAAPTAEIPTQDTAVRPTPIAEITHVQVQENKGPKLKTIVTPDQANTERPELSEMASARRSFFMDSAEEEIVLDNDTIKQKYDTLEVLRNDLKNEKKEEEQKPVAAVGENSPASVISSESSKKGSQQGDYSYFDDNQSEEDEYEDQATSGVFAKVVLIVIILLLVAEVTILGIKYFMPDSQATAFIQDKEIIIVENVTAWINSIKNMFAK